MLSLFNIAGSNNYKGRFATSAELQTKYPTASLADYAYVNNTSSYWYWNSGLATPSWVNQEITESAYLALVSAAKAAVPYIVGV